MPSPALRFSAFALYLLPVCAGAQVLFREDLETQSPDCWASRPNSGGYNRTGCGDFTNIGGYPLALAWMEKSHGGTKSLSVTYTANEQQGGANLNFSADSVHVRFYLYFDQDFDFAQGLKLGRLSSFNTTTQVNDIDIVLVSQTSSSASQCGITENNAFGVYHNGRPADCGWAPVNATLKFARQRWYCVEWSVLLNRPGVSNGRATLWVDGAVIADRTGMNIRGSLPATVHLNRAMIGGWYSNGGYNNACPNPASTTRLYMDDIVVSKAYVGP